MVSTGNISAMSAFSKSAQQAMANIKGQVIAGQKSRIEVTEQAEKLAESEHIVEAFKELQKLHEQWKALDVQAKIEYENRAHEENVRRLREME